MILPPTRQGQSSTCTVHGAAGVATAAVDMGWSGGKRGKKNTTTNLPLGLSDELGLDDADAGPSQRRAKPAVTLRKEKRKQDKLLKKRKRAGITMPEPTPVPAAATQKRPRPQLTGEEARLQQEKALAKKAAKAAKQPPPPVTPFVQMLQERGLVQRQDGSAATDAFDEHIEELERKLGLHKGSKGAKAKERLQRELSADGCGARVVATRPARTAHGTTHTLGACRCQIVRAPLPSIHAPLSLAASDHRPPSPALCQVRRHTRRRPGRG